MGLLSSMLTGGAAGGFQAYGQVKDEEIKAAREAEKEAALTARMENMARLQREYQTSERLATQMHQEGVQQKGFDRTDKASAALAKAAIGENPTYEGVSGEGVLSLTKAKSEQAQRDIDNARNVKKDKLDADTASRQSGLYAMSVKEHDIKMKELTAQSGDKDLERKVNKVYAGWVDGDITPQQLENMPSEIKVGVESKHRTKQAEILKLGLENTKTQAEIGKINYEAGGGKDLKQIKLEANKAAAKAASVEMDPALRDKVYQRTYESFLKNMGVGTQGTGSNSFDDLLQKISAGQP